MGLARQGLSGDGRRGQSPWIFSSPSFPALRGTVGCAPCRLLLRLARCFAVCACRLVSDRRPTRLHQRSLLRVGRWPTGLRGCCLLPDREEIHWRAATRTSSIRHARIFHFLLSAPLTETRLISCVSPPTCALPIEARREKKQRGLLAAVDVVDVCAPSHSLSPHRGVSCSEASFGDMCFAACQLTTTSAPT